jgi:methyl-accepting chemotaxis protein
MSENMDLQERLAFLKLDDEARAALADTRPVVEAALSQTLDAFYDQVRATPDVAHFFNSETHISGAKSAQA